jgi:hypothetical protein
MSRSVVPAIVLVTLTIMFGSSLLAQRHAAGARTGVRESRQLATRGVPSASDPSPSGHGKNDRHPEARVASADRVSQAAPPR